MTAVGLPLTPWWHHPNHRYEGKHRGTYQHYSGNLCSKFGLRAVKLTPYIDANGNDLMGNSMSLAELGFTTFRIQS